MTSSKLQAHTRYQLPDGVVTIAPKWYSMGQEVLLCNIGSHGEDIKMYQEYVLGD